MLQNLMQHVVEGKRRARALILAPTRELAIQVAEAVERMAQGTGLRVVTVYGGQAYSVQVRPIQRGVDVVVGTPGRLIDLIKQEVLDLSQVRYLVLDEADEMLEMGFIEDVETILAQVPAERQTALFSATMPDTVRRLADRYISEPEHIAINRKQVTVEGTEQRAYRVREENKVEALVRLFEVETVKSALIFARTKLRAQELADTLAHRGYPAEALHGDLSQARREWVLNRFRQRMVTILVATDVAARGLDIEDVSHVINVDPPADAEDYVHRIGRTGRAGRKGIAITFFHPRDRVRRKEIEAYTRQPMAELPLPTQVDVQNRREDRFVERVYELLMQGDDARERALVARLAEAGLDLADIAAAAIRMARAGEAEIQAGELNEPAALPRAAREKRERPGAAGASAARPWKEQNGGSAWAGAKNGRNGQPEGVRIPAARGRRGDRTQEGGMVRLVMNLGESHGLRPGDVVGAIASEVGIPGKAIGEISIQRRQTYVDISEKHVQKVLQASGGKYQLHGRPVVLTLAG
jgi:ATP-dependent RNA helicase DeaD